MNEFVARKGIISIGSLTLPYSAVTSAYTIQSTDYFISASGTFNVTLPTAVGIKGKIYTIKNNGTGIITVNTTSSQTIDGIATIQLNRDSSVQVTSNGSNWYIIGSSGTNGTSGTSGSSGTNGTSGSSGTNGTSGTSGSSGTNGTNGTSGSSGTNGTSGSSGTNGTNGTSGSSGTNGTSGTSGSSGTNGTSGSSGTSGTSGSSGTNGTSGSSGTNGTSGTSGSSGTNGTSGSSGTNGASGIKGAPGSSGTNGTNGTSGSSGTNGTSGSSGTSGFSNIINDTYGHILTSTGTSGVIRSESKFSIDNNSLYINDRNLEYRIWNVYSEEVLYFVADNGSGGYISPCVSPSQMNFTGQHRTVPTNLSLIENVSGITGMIVISDGTYKNISNGGSVIPTINESLPNVSICTEPRCKKVFGVISDQEDLVDGVTTYGSGAFMTIVKTYEEYGRLIINSLGEGAVCVCNINGNLENGDYITSSEIPGLGMKQDDDLLHNYTVAKITQDCDFSDPNKYEEIIHNSVVYRKQLVGCTYHCG